MFQLTPQNASSWPCSPSTSARVSMASRRSVVRCARQSLGRRRLCLSQSHGHDAQTLGLRWPRVLAVHETFSPGHFSWWPTATTPSVTLSAWESTYFKAMAIPTAPNSPPTGVPSVTGHEGRLIIPRQPGARIRKHFVAMFLHRDQIVQGIDARLHTRRNHAGEDTRDVRTMLRRVEQRVLPLTNTQFQRPLRHIIVERRARLFTTASAYPNAPA